MINYCKCGCGEKLRKDNKTGYQKCHKPCDVCGNLVKRSDTECCSKSCSAKLHWIKHPELKENRVWNKSRNDVRSKNPNWKKNCSIAAKKSFQSGRKNWNAGKTKETDVRLEQYGKLYKKKIDSGEIKPPFLGRKHAPGWYEKMIKVCEKKYGVKNPGSLAFKNGNGCSKLELSVKEHFEKLGYKSSITIGNYVVDYLNESKKEIIEINGDYWHCNPLKYAPDYYNKKLGMTASDKWKYDEERKQYLENLGYSVTILWESDLKITKKERE